MKVIGERGRCKVEVEATQYVRWNLGLNPSWISHKILGTLMFRKKITSIDSCNILEEELLAVEIDSWAF